MLDGIKPLFTARFVKFCAVGASGVLVNLGSLALLADLLRLHVNVAAALAILVSINTNFAVNELWTFRDRRTENGGLGRRWLRFHLVSVAGGAIQWLVFVGANLAFALVLGGEAGEPIGLREAVVDPAQVGPLKYVSQLLGIGVATLWNFFANFHWTWKRDSGGAR
jgi:putative flippase GtrA